MSYLKKFWRIKLSAGMTYVELMVAIAIFFIMSGVVLSNYRTFEDRVNIINLANDIGLKIVGAQKDASSGALPPSKAPSVSWKPAYGVLFDLNNDLNNNNNNTNFVYFTDLSGNGYCDTSCKNATNSSSGIDYLDRINITGGNTVSNLEVFYQIGSSVDFAGPLSLVFTRSSPGVIFGTYNPSYIGSALSGVDYVVITLSSPSGSTSEIKVYSSGRIQIH